MFREFVEGDGVWLSIVSAEHDRVVEYFVVRVTTEVQTVPPAFLAHDGTTRDRVPAIETDLDFMLQLDPIVELSFLEHVQRSGVGHGGLRN